MKLVEPFVRYVNYNSNEKNIEFAGRVCYKSQDKITEESHVQFIKSIIERGHTSVLEHSNIIIEHDYSPEFNSIGNGARQFDMNNYLLRKSGDSFFKYSKNLRSGNARAWINFFYDKRDDLFTMSLLSLFVKEYPAIFSIVGEELLTTKVKKGIKKLTIEFISQEELLNNKTISNEDKALHLRATFHLRTDRSITHQLVRMRALSFSQESQRYVNYSTDKQDQSVKFITPEGLPEINLGAFSKFCKMSEVEYMKNINLFKMRPEVARYCLPNCTASEIVITGNVSDLLHTLSLRLDSHAQTDVQALAQSMRDQLIKVFGEDIIPIYEDGTFPEIETAREKPLDDYSNLEGEVEDQTETDIKVKSKSKVKVKDTDTTSEEER